MTKIIAYTYTEYRRHITIGLMGLCGLLGCIYAAHVYTLISRTVAFQHMEAQAAALVGNIEALDARYLELSGNITPDVVRSRGLTQGKVSEYISRTASLGRVALAGHEF